MDCSIDMYILHVIVCFGCQNLRISIDTFIRASLIAMCGMNMECSGIDNSSPSIALCVLGHAYRHLC